MEWKGTDTGRNCEIPGSNPEKRHPLYGFLHQKQRAWNRSAHGQGKRSFWKNKEDRKIYDHKSHTDDQCRWNDLQTFPEGKNRDTECNRKEQ